MTPQPTSHTSNRWWVIAALILGIALFTGGYFIGRTPLAEVQAERVRLQTSLVKAHTVASLQSTRALLYQSAAELDRRNFGIANTNLRAALAELKQISPIASNAFTQNLAQLRDDVTNLNLNVAVDLREQRLHVLDLAEQATALVKSFVTANPK